MNESKDSQFEFKAKITRAFKDSKTGKLFIEGVASSTSIDWHETIFNENCQQNWISDLESGLPTYIEINHQGVDDWTKRIGKVLEARTQPNPDKENITDFYIKAELNKKDSDAIKVFNAITNPDTEYGQPEELGFSINGTVDESHIELIDGKAIEVFDKVRLRMIGVVEYASNPDTFVTAIKRSMSKNKNDIKENNLSSDCQIGKEKETKMKDEKLSTPELPTNIAEDIVREAEPKTEVDGNEQVELEQIVMDLPTTPAVVREENDVPSNEKSPELVAAANKMLLDLMNDLNKMSDVSVDNLLTIIYVLMDRMSGTFRWDVAYDVLERGIKPRIEQLKSVNRTKDTKNINENELTQREIKREMSQEANTNEPVATPEVAAPVTQPVDSTAVMTEMLEVVRAMKAEMATLKEANENLVARKVEADNKPAVAVANLINAEPAQTQTESDLTGDDLMTLYREGKLSQETMEKVRVVAQRRFFGLPFTGKAK